METRVSGSQIYIGNTPVVLSESHSLVAEDPKPGKDFSNKGSWSFTVNTKVSRKILRWMTLGDRRHSRFMKQLILLKRKPKHYESIFRCLRYGDKIPRKYMRMYKEVIKSVLIKKER